MNKKRSKLRWNADKIEPFLFAPMFVLVAGCLVTILLGIVVVLFGGGLIAHEFGKQFVEAGYSFVPFCLGVIGTYLVIKIPKLDVGFLVQAQAAKNSEEVTKRKQLWIESLDPGISGTLLGFLLFLLPVIFHIVLKITLALEYGTGYLLAGISIVHIVALRKAKSKILDWKGYTSYTIGASLAIIASYIFVLSYFPI